MLVIVGLIGGERFGLLIMNVQKNKIIDITPSLGKGAVACEIAGRGCLRPACETPPYTRPEAGIAHTQASFKHLLLLISNTEHRMSNIEVNFGVHYSTFGVRY
jgi:hypothetical protein